MKSFDEWKEANLDEQAAVPTAMEKIEKAKLMGKSQTLLKRWLDEMASAGPLTKSRKLSALAQVIEILELTPQEVSMMGTKVKGAIKKDASATLSQDGGLAGAEAADKRMTKAIGFAKQVQAGKQAQAAGTGAKPAQ